MDHQELEYIPRKIGESWSCYWNTYKPHRSPETPPQTNWDFFTPPYTPRTEVSPTASSETSNHSNDQNRLINAYSKESNSSKVSPNHINEENIIKIDIDEIEIKENINSSLSNNLELLPDITNPSLNKVENISCTLKNLENNLKTVTTRAPTIVNIETMNLVNVADIRKLPGEKLILKSQEKCKKENTLVTSIQEENSKEKLKKSIVTLSEIEKNENPIQNQTKMEVKTVKLEGLPIVTLSYEVPDFLTEINNQKEKKLEQESKVTSEIDKSNNVLSKKSIMASKMFQKFDFGELRRLKDLKKKKKEDENKNEEDSANEEDITNEKNIEIQKVIILNDDDKDSLVDTKTISESINYGKTFSPLSEDSKDVISDLDSFLNDYIEDIKSSTDENITNLTDDDWLSSLLV